MNDHEEFDDIPGTTVFTTKRSRQGFQLNQFCMSLMKPENRERFRGDERTYLDEWSMTEAQKQAVLARDYNAAIAEGATFISSPRSSPPTARVSSRPRVDDRHDQRRVRADDALRRPLARGQRSIKEGR